MFKRISYVFFCAIILSGCGKFVLNEDKKETANQVQTDQFAEEESILAESSTGSESDMTKQMEDNTVNMENSVNNRSESETDTEITDRKNDSNTEILDTNNKTGNTSCDSDEELKSKTIAKKYNLAEGFVYVDDVIPSVELEIRYYTDYNFVGEKIDGYVAPLGILTTQAADSLKVAADKLAVDGYRIRIYDAYRPQKAVEHFVRWAQTDDASRKDIFYPSMEKSILFSDGYISNKSRHSRGSTVDLTIVDKDDNEIDMGGYFDLLDTVSNYDTDLITDAQHANREYLRNIMDEAGFDSIRTEWWHFQLRDEPYPDTYFDFDIE